MTVPGALRGRLIHLPRSLKRVILAFNDFFIIEFSLLASFYLRLQWHPVDLVTVYSPVFLMTPLCVLFFLYHLGLYRSVTRHAGLEVLLVLTRGVSLGALVILLIFFLKPIQPQLPRSVLMGFWVFGVLLLFFSRLIAGKWLHGTSLSALAMEFAGGRRRRKVGGRPVLVYGAGAAGRQLVGALAQGTRYLPVAFIDDNPHLQGGLVGGIKVHGPVDLPELVSALSSPEIFLALPSISSVRRREILRFLEPFDLRVRSVPSMEELARGLVRVDAIREVDVADILGRETVPPDVGLLEQSISGRRILVTGAGGSIGSELCRQILKYRPASLVLLDHSEFNLYTQFEELKQQVVKAGSSVTLVPVLGSVLDAELVIGLLHHHQIDILYHAAAYKHVPLVEANGCRGFVNNVLGTLQVAIAAIQAQVPRFVLVSTDKAVRPTNFMGASKRLAELTLQALAARKTLEPGDIADLAARIPPPKSAIAIKTCFTMVRFGNVLDSSGSVIPKFRKQIQAGGPVTVTHPNVTRFFMTIPEAAELVLQANALSEGGDLFILDMGAPVKIDDLARQLIHLSGLSVRDADHPEGDIEIVYTGIRPGEKLYEELLIDDTAKPTRHPKIWRANECAMAWPELAELLVKLETAFKTDDRQRVGELLSRPEIGYRQSGS